MGLIDESGLAYQQYSDSFDDVSWFRTKSEPVAPALIRDSQGIIEGASVVSVGEATGHGVFLDEEFVSYVVTLGNQNPVGLKARFGHPNMCNEALGTYLGRWKNFRLSADNQKALADLYLDESAKNTPGGDLYHYTLTLARTAPDQFGASIVFRRGESYYKDKAGNNTKNSKEAAEGEGNAKEYIMLKSLLGADLVDEPAANASGLFGTENFNSKSFAVIATQFLAENPAIRDWVLGGAENEILNFLKKYKKRMNKSHGFDLEIFESRLKSVEDFMGDIDKKFNDVTALEGKIAALEGRLSALEALPGSEHNSKGASKDGGEEYSLKNLLMEAPHNKFYNI